MSNSELWCVGIRPEGDSPHKQSPAESKEIAERVIERYRAMTTVEGNRFLIEEFDDLIQLQRWHGTRRDHIRQVIFNEDWFNQAMYQCKNMEQARQVFKYGEIVTCYKGSEELTTRDFEEAKQFFGETA